MERTTIVQKLKKRHSLPIEIAIKYYSLLSTINDLKLTEREIQLVAFTALKGNISYGSIGKSFVRLIKALVLRLITLYLN